MNPVLIGFLTYLVLVLLVGLATYRLNETGEDYLLAGRRLNIWVATFSERASGESAWLLLGLPGAVLTTGLVEVWSVVGCVSGIALSWWIVAGPLRRETQRLGALTIPEYFVRRFGAAGQTLRITATAIVIFFFAFYLSAQVKGAGDVLEVTFDIPPFWGMILGTSVIVAYTVMGGFFAVAWTDLIQGIIMLSTLVVLPLVAWVEVTARGIDVTAALERLGPGVASLVHGETGWAAAAAVVGGLSWGLGYLGQPHVIVRYMSVRNPKAVKAGKWIAISWAALAFTGALFIGIFGAALVGDALGKNKEHLMPFLATHLLHPWLAGIFISGAVAAMMSTADSQLLVTTSAVSEDVVHRMFRPSMTQRDLVRISRITALVVGILAFLLAVTSTKLNYNVVSYAWSGLGASFGPGIVLSLHWKRTTGKGVLAGMLVGTISTVVWSSIPALEGLITVRFVSFLLAGLAVVLVSLADRRALSASD